jgi:hypothetical protein
LLNVPSSTQLQLNTNTTGDIFFGFGQTAGASLTVFAGQLRIRQGSVANTFQIALVNSGAGNLVPSVFSQDLRIGETYFLVVKLRRTTSPIQATLWINPIPGTQNPPASSQYSTQGTNALSTFASVFMRQSGTASAGTGNLQIDEIRIGTTWESVTPCASPIKYYADSDDDSYGDPNSSIQACSLPSGYVLDNSDCDDKNASINPNTIWYADADGDGFGNVNSTQNSCNQPSGYVSNSTDCNDNDANNNALATYYQDADQDGFGNLSVSQSSCGQPSGYVTNSTDCDDKNATVNVISWYEDADGDGFGNPSKSIKNCTKPDNYVSNTTDCDDTNDQIYPGATEICDSKDNNCDGKVDEGFDLKTYYTDADGDGFGDEATGAEACAQPQNTVTIGGDCDDKNKLINPNAQDVSGNSIDENCDGVDGNVGIPEVSGMKLYVSPNPNEGSFLIQLNQIVNNAEINLTDLNGKVIQVYRFHGDSIQIKENNLEKGFYLVQVSFNENKLVQRIMIQ